jgi:hypothetical protein
MRAMRFGYGCGSQPKNKVGAADSIAISKSKSTINLPMKEE